MADQVAPDPSDVPFSLQSALRGKPLSGLSCARPGSGPGEGYQDPVDSPAFSVVVGHLASVIDQLIGHAGRLGASSQTPPGRHSGIAKDPAN